MKKNKPTVLIDIGRVNKPYCGLGEVAIQFGKALEKYDGDDFHFRMLCHPLFEKYLNQEVGIEYHVADLSWLNKSIHILTSNAHRMYPLVNEVDLWHLLQLNSRWLPNKLNIPLSATIHDMHSITRPRSAIKVINAIKKKHRYQKILSRLKAVGFISQVTSDEVNKCLTIPESTHKTVIHNGVALSSSNIRPSWWKEDKPFLFCICEIRERKNIHILPQIMAYLPDDWCLILAGRNSSHYAKNIQANIIDLGLEHRVLMPGFVSKEEKGWLLHNCVAFVFPSIVEGFGLPPLEAMLCNKPVFVSSTDIAHEVYDEHAIYFGLSELKNPKNMAQCILSEIEGFTQSTKAQHAYAHAQSCSWDRNVQSYIAIWKNILGVGP